MLNTYQDLFGGHYYEIPDGYKVKTRINYIDGTKSKKFAKPPTLAEIEGAALAAGFDKKVTFPNVGLAGLTKFFKLTTDQPGELRFQKERKCLEECV